MKKTLILFLSLACSLVVNAQKYVIIGKAPVGTDKVYLTPLTESPIDSTTVDASGNFVFSGDAEGKHLAMVGTTGTGATRMVVFLENTLHVDLINKTLAGNDENRLLNDYVVFSRESAKPLTELVARLNDKYRRGETITEEEMATYEYLSDSISSLLMARVESDLEAYKTMRWPAYIVIDNANDLSPEQLIALDTPENVFMTEPCLGKVKNLIAAYRRTQIGEHFADFEMPDTAGVVHKLSEFVGQGHYVLLDFWATWCGPCMRELPNVKALYDKYHDQGLDIVGISFDNDGDNWRAVIQNKKMNWIHLSDLAGWKSLPVDFYGVHAIPHTILIDPNGIIIAKNLTGEDLAEKLQEIFE